MKTKRILAVLVTLIVLCLAGCDEADRVSRNLSKEADNFNVVRQLTVINCITGDTLFQMTGKLSIESNVEKDRLEIVVENEDGGYCKHFVGGADNLTYIVEQLSDKHVDKYRYTLNFNPKMWIPVTPDIID